MKKLLLFLAFCSISLAQAQYTAIPDVNFERKLIALNLDNLKDGKVLTTNISLVTDLDVHYASILDLTGIQDFVKLEVLNCTSNYLSSLDVSKNLALKELYCYDNELTTLDVTKNIALEIFTCYGNQLTNLDVTKNTALTHLYCFSNPLTNLDVTKNTALVNLTCNGKVSAINTGYDINLSSLDVSNNTALKELYCNANKLTTLDLTKNTLLELLSCDENQLTSLDVSKCPALTDLNCSLNQITTLDVKNNIYLTSLNCSENQITTLDVKNNIYLTSLNCSKNQLSNNLDLSKNIVLSSVHCSDNQLQSLFAKNGCQSMYTFANNNPLKFVCIDDFNNPRLYCTNKPKVVINSYCSFTPGGIFYSIQGTTKLDINDNGCDLNDISYPNLSFKITNSNVIGGSISNKTGNYTIPLQSGNYSVIPIIENIKYFTASPTSITVNFPTQTSPFNQDICITPNGVHHDVEAVLIPKDNAVPGFEANYKLVYKNKGTQTESGQITLSFDDTLMDFVSAAIAPLKVENGLLTFEYTALQLFDSKVIDLVFKMNKPTDLPALNGGDVLTFVASISGNTPEETPLDNVSTLKQTVLNSFDPNDKTCLEGNTVTPELVGQYVHYVVRFENTGTLEAKNIVVKDMIDTTKFDVSSLIVTNSSHSCVTKISETNKVEFIFENINLPFDNANNDGYIAFKIKTLPSLVVGDTFSNTADIFFDYNFPITTNEAKTTVEVLSTNDFAFENYFSLYPNPAKNNLTLNTKNNIEVKNINIFNVLGQLVISIPNAQTVSNFDVSRLITGTYFVKIVTNKGTSTTKFIKE